MIEHDADCDAVGVGPDLEPSTKPCNCGADNASQIIRMSRLLRCASGFHEPLIRPIAMGGVIEEPVRFEIPSRDHGPVHAAICRHCRVLYMRRRDE